MIAMRLAGKSLVIGVLIVATAAVAWQLERQRSSGRALKINPDSSQVMNNLAWLARPVRMPPSATGPRR